MPGTNRLYLADAYQAACDSRVISDENGWWNLAETVFYPGGGGQPADAGTIRTAGQTLPVLQVRIDDDRVWHRVDHPADPGTAVRCEIDWERRYAFMRHHALLHIVNAVAFRRFTGLITGTLIGTDVSRIDFRFGDFDRAMLPVLEDEVNEVINQACRVSAETISEAEFRERPDLIRTLNVLPPIVDGTVRIVSMAGFDAQACGGTHVHSTSEIGRARITKYENKGRNNKRLYWKLTN